uniref:Uncharacterized protein n=1 Tax=Anopheles culicifacies TaxID=139723 RepID=A0A182MTV9_9DIPT
MGDSKILLDCLSSFNGSDKNIMFLPYASILESFCSVPLPADPFSLLTPIEDDEVEENSKSDEDLDDLETSIGLEECDNILLDLIDQDINELSAEPRPLVVCPMVEHGSHCQHPVGEPSQMILANFERDTTANKQPLRVAPLNIAATSPTTLPEWLVKPEAFADPTHQLCSIVVQDCNAKRIELLYMHIDEKMNDTTKPTNVVQDTKSASKSVTENGQEETIPKVPPQVVEPQRQQQSAWKLSEEKIERASTAKELSIALLSEKLREHFQKLSSIHVPVLGSSSADRTKSRRKQTIVTHSIDPEPMAVDPEDMVDAEACSSIPTFTIMKLRSSNVAIASVSSSGTTNIRPSIGQSPGRVVRSSKPKKKGRIMRKK